MHHPDSAADLNRVTSISSPSPTAPADRRGRATVAAVAAVAVIGVIALMFGAVTRAAFLDTTDNSGNTFASGDVVLDDDDQGNVLFNVTGLAPGASVVRCVEVTYTGSLTADVRLYGTVGGSGLAQFLDTDIEVGTGGSAASCAGFTPTSSLYTGTLDGFAAAHDGYLSGLQGFNGATDPTSRTYRISVTLQDDQAAQALTGTLDLTWEAQNI